MNQQVLYDYAEAGGRVFASHLHYAWFYTGPFSTQNLATWLPSGNCLGDINANVVATTWNGQPFARGQAFYDWLLNVNALDNDLLPIIAARLNADVTVINTPSQPGSSARAPPPSPSYFTFDTPLGAAAAQQCGRVTYTDMHVSNAATDYDGASTDHPRRLHHRGPHPSGAGAGVQPLRPLLVRDAEQHAPDDHDAIGPAGTPSREPPS